MNGILSIFIIYILNMDLIEKKMRLIWTYNALQEQIDAYGLNDIAITSKPLKEMCAKRDQIELEIKEINKLLWLKE